METLRDLLVQRAARLQGRPALSAPGWGTLSWAAWRNRVEGVAFGLMAEAPGPSISCDLPAPWAWACEVSAACCGLRWESGAPAVDPALLGGSRFHAEAGRAPYHALEKALDAATPFCGALAHGELLARLRRLTTRLGWDHETRLLLPVDACKSPEARGALWSLLFAGGHAVLDTNDSRFDPTPYLGLLNP